MNNKRNLSRRNSPHRINVLLAEDERVLGRLVNITTGGLMFLTSDSGLTSGLLRVRLPLPTMTKNRTSIEVEGEIVWTAPDANERYHRVGIQFTNLGAEEGYLIETVLQRLHLVG